MACGHLYGNRLADDIINSPIVWVSAGEHAVPKDDAAVPSPPGDTQDDQCACRGGVCTTRSDRRPFSRDIARKNQLPCTVIHLCGMKLRCSSAVKWSYPIG